MGKKSKPKEPPPVDPGESMGEYLFGQGFKNYQGVTDPELQERLIGAEETYRPRYAALELQDIATAARGIQDPTQTSEYRALQSELDSLKSISDGLSSEEALQIARSSAGSEPSEYYYTVKSGRGAGRGRSSSSRRKVKNKNYEKEKREYDKRVKDIASSLSGNREARIASIESQLSSLSAQGGTPGLFDLLEEQSQRAGELQRSEAEKQRAADVGALQEYAPQVVEAYRQADPRSAELADLASQKAKESLGLAEAGQGLLGGSEQEDLLSKRGMELAASTGELTPLEKRRLEQQSRAGSLARGREMDSSSIYDEAQSRMAEELNKREREIALGSGLLGQQASMRSQRMGLGAGLIGQEAAIGGQRLGQAFGMQRGMAGDVGMTLLGRPTQSIGLGGQLLGQSQGLAAGPMGPQLFDPNVGINMALQQRGQDMSLMGANQQARAASMAGMMGAIGKIGGAYAGGF